jgi:PIN domain nuclease of toxin-antitoxin system
MKCLLDTHTFLWALISPDKLSKTVQLAITHPNNPVMVSAVTFWHSSFVSANSICAALLRKRYPIPR